MKNNLSQDEAPQSTASDNLITQADALALIEQDIDQRGLLYA